MLRNSFRLAFRTLRKHKSYTVINIFGLAVSMSICLLIILFIHDQKSYDQFHLKKDRIVRITTDRVDGSDVSKLAATPAPLARALLSEGTGIENATRLGQIRTNAIHDGASLSVTGLYADPSFFSLFDFPVQGGSPETVLSAPYQMVLNEQTAVKFFGDANPVGRVITLEGIGDVTVSGIVVSGRGKSHLRFDMLVSFATVATTNLADELYDWTNFHHYATYLLLTGKNARPSLRTQLDNIASSQYGPGSHRFEIQNLTDITLGELYNNEISSFSLPGFVVYFLGALGFVVLIAAGFNYVSLTIARSLQRAREVGVRKAIGARRSQIVFQLLTESLLVSLLSLVIAYVLVSWLLSGFNSLSIHAFIDARIDRTALLSWQLFLLFLSFSAIVGLVAGIYPALYLSSFQTVGALKGSAANGFSGLPLRRILIVSQFTFSIAFVITAVLLYNQFKFMVNGDYGFSTADIINVELQGISYDIFRAEMLQNPGVIQVAATSTLPASGSTSGIRLITSAADTLDGHGVSIDPHFLETLDLSLVAGRNFSSDFATDSSQAFIVNETAVAALGSGRFESVIGTAVEIEPYGSGHIVGVVDDYQYDTMDSPIGLLALRYEPSQFRFASIRVQSGATENVENAIERTWQKLDPVHPVSYASFSGQLRDNPLNKLFNDLLRIIGLITVVTLVIAALGLLSMTAFNVERRTKEIGIRKVLGATVSNLTWLLSREFVALMGIAAILAVPLGYFPNNLWLESFANRVDFGVNIFATSFLFLLVLALLTVGSQALKGALSNPVQSLRYE